MIFDFIGYFAIPFFTVTLSRETSLFSTNFSSIRAENHRQTEFLLWSFILLIYLFLCLLPFFYRQTDPEISKKDCLRKKHGPSFLLLLFLGSAVLFLTAIFTPYLPEKEPFWSQIHVYTSIWASISFLLLLFRAAFSLYFQSQQEGRILLGLLLTTCSFCASSYLITGIVNSAMEIVYTIFCCITANRIRLFFSDPLHFPS